MSVKKTLYQAIKASLIEIEEIKNVMHYNGQDTLNFEKDLSVRFPIAWIQLTSINWKPSELVSYNKNRTRQQKTEDCTITIFIATFSLKNDDDTFEDDLDLIDLVYRKLTMLDGDNFTPLERVNEQDVATNNNVRVWTQTYSTMLTEMANASELEDAAPVTLVINKNLIQ